MSKEDPWGLFTPVPEAPEYPAKEKYQAHLLEQYKLYVEMADRVSTRRLTTNAYFVSLNSAVLAFVGYLMTKNETSQLWVIGTAGLVLTLLWRSIIKSYGDLNTAKFTVIHYVEQRLPLSLYAAEWNAAGRGTDPKKYRPISHTERLVPWVFVALYGYVILLSVFS